MTPELTIVGLAVAATSAVFALYQRGVASQIETIKDACAAKDTEIAWLRTQLDAWTQIGRSAVATAEKLTESQK